MILFVLNHCGSSYAIVFFSFGKYIIRNIAYIKELHFPLFFTKLVTPCSCIWLRFFFPLIFAVCSPCERNCVAVLLPLPGYQVSVRKTVYWLALVVVLFFNSFCHWRHFSLNSAFYFSLMWCCLNLVASLSNIILIYAAVLCVCYREKKMANLHYFLLFWGNSTAFVALNQTSLGAPTGVFSLTDLLMQDSSCGSFKERLDGVTPPLF